MHRRQSPCRRRGRRGLELEVAFVDQEGGIVAATEGFVPLVMAKHKTMLLMKAKMVTRTFMMADDMMYGYLGTACMRDKMNAK